LKRSGRSLVYRDRLHKIYTRTSQKKIINKRLPR
jgi:hypothetical protein